jgi:creatinine amidohydrolase
MQDLHKNDGFETRYEWLRPAQLIARRNECPLVLFPMGPLEYHGPHMPVGMDPLNATYVAHACCSVLKRGVVRPTMFLGTERERDPDTLESLGFKRDQYIVGMDFPARQWNSHYIPEEVFALTVAAELRCLIGQDYKNIFIINGHGAVNHNQVLRRLCVELSNTTPAKVHYANAALDSARAAGALGHADLFETSLLMYYKDDSIDLSALPPNNIPLKYADFSIVDGVGFTPASRPEREVPAPYDPRRATIQIGKDNFERIVAEICGKIEETL